jgi:SAM-dependent MidA family methyltransferase
MNEPTNFGKTENIKNQEILVETATNANLEALLRQHIATEGPLTFARFMEIVLYTPGLGYYTRRPNLIGARGDFYTAPHLTPVFGELVALQLAEFWERLGQPSKFTLVEMGAGQGLLAGDVLKWLQVNRPQLWAALEYKIVEVSEFLITGQRRRLQAVSQTANLLEKVSWCSLEEIPEDSVEGAFFSNELVDALPVHLVQLEQGHLCEIYVTTSDITTSATQPLIEVSGPLSTPALSAYFENLGLDLSSDAYSEGYRTEVNLAALEWLSQIASKLKRGYLLTIDYGYTAPHRYHPRRSEGTLQCYFRHNITYNPYLHLGEQDITAHVDFSSLLLVGEQQGLDNLGFTTQAAFLASLGIETKFNDLILAIQEGRSPTELLQERQALQRLLNPTEMGNFGVLIQSKNLKPVSTVLAGLSLKL